MAPCPLPPPPSQRRSNRWGPSDPARVSPAMSLRPSERKQTRKGNYKQSVDAEESRRHHRHEGQMVDIRKAKREESLQKKRHVGNLCLAGVSGSPSAAAAVLLLRPALTRPISTGFREERDTFGPIQMQRSLQNFDISGERERMPVPIIHAFGVLKKCAAKGQHDEIEAKFFEE